MFAFSLSTALLGAACTAEVGDSTESSNLSEEAAALETTDSASSAVDPLVNPQPIDGEWDRGWGGYGSYCERECYRMYRYCASGYGGYGGYGGYDDYDRYDYGYDRGYDRGYGRGMRCRRRLDRCVDRCRYRY
jgi:hypothetical protein